MQKYFPLHFILFLFRDNTQRIDGCLLWILNGTFMHPGLADFEAGKKHAWLNLSVFSTANSCSTNIQFQKGSSFGFQTLIRWSREHFAGLSCGKAPLPLAVTLHVPHGFLLGFYKCSSPPASWRERPAGCWGHGLDAFFCSAGQRVMLTSCSRKATLCLSFWGAADEEKKKPNKFKQDGEVPHTITEGGTCSSSWFRPRSFLLVDHLQEHPETI